MNRFLLFFLLLGPCVAALAQSSIQPTITDREIGTDYRTNTPLKAREFNFGMPVYRIHPLPDGQTFAVMLRKKNVNNNELWGMKGEVMVFDQSSRETKWRRKFKYAQSQLLLDDHVILEQRGNKLERLNPENGMPIWTAKGTAFKVYPELNRALCYDMGSDGRKIMHGVDLGSGKSLWQRGVPGLYGWESIDMLDDTTALIKSSGIHTVSLTNGFGWDVDRVSHAEKVDMKKVGLAVLTGVTVGALGAGLYYMPYGNFSNMFLEISSNPVFDNDAVFFAAKNKISCHSLSGKTVWSTDLNEKQTSKSHLFKEGNVIYMINTGYAMKFGQPSRFGTPFVAAFDAATGQQLFMKVWEERKNYFTDYMIQGHDLYLLYRDKLEIHEFTPEGLTQKYKMGMFDDTHMKEFVSDNLFTRTDSACSQLSLDRDHYYIHSEEGDLLKFTNEFVLVGKVDKNTLYKNCFETGRFRFLGNPAETFIFNKADNRLTAQLPVPLSATMMGSKLYYREQGSNIVEVDISRFLDEMH